MWSSKNVLCAGAVVLALAATSALVASPPASAAGERASYQVHKTVAAIQVDGRLDEPVWRAAQTFAFFNNADGSAPAPDLATAAKALYDDTFIYFAFESADPNAWSTRKERDEHLWEEEVVEVFIQADPEHPSYIELEVNPLGTMIDIFLIDVRRPIPYTTWNSAGLRWAVQVEGTVDGQPGDRGWSCEIALPLAEVITAPNIPPRAGDRWRANLYRVERRPSRASLAWSPTLVGRFYPESSDGKACRGYGQCPRDGR